MFDISIELTVWKKYKLVIDQYTISNARMIGSTGT